jgi:hypothetical protein
VILIGGPDSGKTNYVGRLWPALNAKTGALIAAEQPQDISFVMDTADHLFQGKFAPRTDRNDLRRDFLITVKTASGEKATSLVIPDISGELWTDAVRDSEIAAEWMSELENAGGALIFVRVLSDQDIRPLDWVTSRKLLATIGQDDADRDKLPTQVLLCELLRYLELKMRSHTDKKPRISVVVSAWDLIDQERFDAGPVAFLSVEYPMFAGKLEDSNKFEYQVFGLSVVGGDLGRDEEFRNKFFDGSFDEHGWVAVYNPTTKVWEKKADLTLPVAWALGV